MKNKFECHNIDLDKTEVNSWSLFSNIVRYTQDGLLQTDTDIKAPIYWQTMKIYVKCENDECILKRHGLWLTCIKGFLRMFMKVYGHK